MHATNGASSSWGKFGMYDARPEDDHSVKRINSRSGVSNLSDLSSVDMSRYKDLCDFLRNIFQAIEASKMQYREAQIQYPERVTELLEGQRQIELMEAKYTYCQQLLAEDPVRAVDYVSSQKSLLWDEFNWAEVRRVLDGNGNLQE